MSRLPVPRPPVTEREPAKTLPADPTHRYRQLQQPLRTEPTLRDFRGCPMVVRIDRSVWRFGNNSGWHKRAGNNTGSIVELTLDQTGLARNERHRLSDFRGIDGDLFLTTISTLNDDMLLDNRARETALIAEYLANGITLIFEGAYRPDVK
jgi:hypothetical protein